MTNSVETKLKEISGRVKALREEMNMTPEQVAGKIDLTTEEYLKFESGTEDLNFTFVYKFANLAGVEISDIMEGSSPALTVWLQDSRTSSASLSVS